MLCLHKKKRAEALLKSLDNLKKERAWLNCGVHPHQP